MRAAARHPRFQVDAYTGHFPLGKSAALRLEASAPDTAPHGVCQLITALADLKKHAVAHEAIVMESGGGGVKCGFMKGRISFAVEIALLTARASLAIKDAHTVATSGYISGAVVHGIAGGGSALWG